MNFFSLCLFDFGLWVVCNFVVVNIKDFVCYCGFDEVCIIFFFSEGNQFVCFNVLGMIGFFRGDFVFNVEFGIGKFVFVLGVGVC